MTSKRIADQIDTIRAAAEKASASPEAALTFLHNAGIISGPKTDIVKAGKNEDPAKTAVAYQHDFTGTVISDSVPVISGRARARYAATKRSK